MWVWWTKARRDELPSEWAPGEWRRAADGAEYRLRSRVVALDPLDQSAELAIRAEKRERGEIVAAEEHRLSMRMYFREELVMMLERAGFKSVRVEGAYTGREPTADDDFLVFIARR
jgi:hypothetical protein